jgi:hypothetical protein
MEYNIDQLLGDAYKGKPISIEQPKPAGRPPDFTGDGVSIWVNQTKEGKAYLSVQILKSIKVACFRRST